jgi:hypothetical protein
MSGPTSETGLVAQIWKRIHAEHPSAWVFKVHGSPYQVAGLPDLLVCVDGLLVGLEVKFIHPGESRQHALDRVTVRQQVQINRIHVAGGTAGVVTSAEEALALVRRAITTRPG